MRVTWNFAMCDAFGWTSKGRDCVLGLSNSDDIVTETSLVATKTSPEQYFERQDIFS